MSLKNLDMRSNYKRLGQYVREVSVKNTDGSVELLLGVGIQKKTMPSKANTIGSDMTKYKVVSKSQFVYGPVTSRNGDRIAIALLEEEKCIVSTSYTVFEVVDREKLLPEYLMMWFRRPEFDRYARFMSHGSAREVFNWEEMCEVELPVPSIEKQHEIVREYEVITDRIALNEKMSLKLEETAQALYKHWFVDFKFPMPADYAESIGKPELTGKPYKSSGGEMKYCEELGCEIPNTWNTIELENTINAFLSNRGKSKSKMNLSEQGLEFPYPVISAMNVNGGTIVKPNTIPFVNATDFEEWMPEKLEQGDVLLTSEAPMGELYYISRTTDWLISQRLFGLKPKSEIICGEFLYFWLKGEHFKRELEGRGSGTSVVGIILSELKKSLILKANPLILAEFKKVISQIFNLKEFQRLENQMSISARRLLLSKLSV